MRYRERIVRGLLTSVLAMAVMGTSACSTALDETPGTPGATIAALEESAASRDWETYASFWDLEAVGDLYEQDSAEVGDNIWVENLKGAPVTAAEPQVREYYPEDILLTRKSLELGLRTYVEHGSDDATRGFPALINLANVHSASVHKDDARIVFRAEGHTPEELVLEFWRVMDGDEEKWIVSRIGNAKDIARARAAF